MDISAFITQTFCIGAALCGFALFGLAGLVGLIAVMGSAAYSRREEQEAERQTGGARSDIHP